MSTEKSEKRTRVRDKRTSFPLKLDRGSLAAIFCAAREKERYALNGLSIGPKECVATDGRKLVVVKHADQNADPDDEQLTPRIAYFEDVQSVLKRLSKKKNDEPDRKEIHVDVSKSNRDGALHVSAPAGTTLREDIKLAPVECTFPNYEDVLPPAGTYTVAVYVNGAFLEQVLKVIDEMNKARTDEADDGMAKGVVIKMYAPKGEPGKFVDTPIRLESRNGDVIAVVMPYVLD